MREIKDSLEEDIVDIKDHIKWIKWKIKQDITEEEIKYWTGELENWKNKLKYNRDFLKRILKEKEKIKD